MTRFIRAATQVAAALPIVLALSFGTSTTPQAKQYSYIIGQTYKINGRTYKPREDLSYDRVGVASWYGPGFHGKKTANGEIYDQNAMTAAHPTLPLSTIVRVTNLANDRSIIVRINDRGPYANDRIIDLSNAAARALGYESQGVARVRVTVLREETLRIKNGTMQAEDDTAAPSATTSSRAGAGR